jgi:hypothetical protein
MDQKLPCLAADLRQTRSIQEWCERYHVRRKPGYQWIERDRNHSPVGREERSRQPPARPHQTPRPGGVVFSELRRLHPAWGAKTLRAMRQKRHPRGPLPARSTVCAI